MLKARNKSMLKRSRTSYPVMRIIFCIKRVVSCCYKLQRYDLQTIQSDKLKLVFVSTFIRPLQLSN